MTLSYDPFLPFSSSFFCTFFSARRFLHFFIILTLTFLQLFPLRRRVNPFFWSDVLLFCFFRFMFWCVLFAALLHLARCNLFVCFAEKAFKFQMVNTDWNISEYYRSRKIPEIYLFYDQNPPKSVETMEKCNDQDQSAV